MSDDAISRLYSSFVGQDPGGAIKVIEGVRQAGMRQTDLFDQLFAPALSMLGESWAAGRLDELAFAQSAVVAEQVMSFVTPPAVAPDTGVTVVLGCAQGDRHATLKNIVAACLKDAGYRVADTGVDSRPAEFLSKVEETGARIVIVFAELVASATGAGKVRAILDADGRQNTALLVGGGPFAADLGAARRAGANGVVTGAESALKLVAKVRERVYVQGTPEGGVTEGPEGS